MRWRWATRCRWSGSKRCTFVGCLRRRLRLTRRRPLWEWTALRSGGAERSMASELAALPVSRGSRLSLRAKLWMGFGGLLLILMTVITTSVIVMTHESRALERMFRDNYDSVSYCSAMHAAIDQ